MNFVLSVPQIAAFIAAGSLAFIGWQLGGSVKLPSFRRGQASRLSAFASPRASAEPESGVAVGSFSHRVRVAFSGVRVNASGREETLLLMARLGAGGVMVVVLLLVGLPFLTSLAGFPGGWLLVNSWVTRSWNKVRTDVEMELPSLLTRLASIIQVSPNVPSALETVAATLNSDGPLSQWCLETAARMHKEGFAAIEAIRENAAGISPSLAIGVELIGRMWTTGGEGYARAFSSAADNLETVLDARIMARAKGSSAQGTVNILTGMTFLMIGFMVRSDAMASMVNTPLVQAAYAAIVLLIIYGYGQVNDLIENAV